VLDRVSRKCITFVYLWQKKQKLPPDTNKRAKSIVAIATGEKDNTISNEIRQAAATFRAERWFERW